MAEDAHTYLDRLAAELERRGWTVRRRGGGLVVTNPDAANLRERVSCRQGDAGDWEFCWSWGDAVGPVGDVAGAADRILRVLRTVDADRPGAAS